MALGEGLSGIRPAQPTGPARARRPGPPGRWAQVALGDDLSGIMDYYLDTATPSLTMAVYVVWIFLSNIVLVGTAPPPS